MVKNIDGNIITLGKEGKFDVIVHGCNCFCRMGSGLAPQMAEAFGCDTFPMEHSKYKGDINKLGCIDYKLIEIRPYTYLKVVNAYTQYRYGKNHHDGVSKPVDYDAIRLCMRKMNHEFKGQRIGLPKIGAGLAGGDWSKILGIIEEEMVDCRVTIINYKKD